MGISWSRRRNNYYQNHPPPPPPLPLPRPPFYSYYPDAHYFPPPPPPLPAAPQPIAQSHNYFTTTSNTTPTPAPQHPSQTNTSYAYSTNHPPLLSAPLPPPPPPPPSQTHFLSGHHSSSYSNSMMGPTHYNPYYLNQANAWPPFRPLAVPTLPPPPYVEHQHAKKVRNDVNVHKDTVKLEIDELDPDRHLVSFVFDALYDGSITIMYFAKEEGQCKFDPLYPEAFKPVVIPFQKGLHQKFIQQSGSGIDLGFFELDDLSKPSSSEDMFPLVICAETNLTARTVDESLYEPIPDTSPHMQITQAIIDKNNSTDPFRVKVIRQILWIDGVRYELRELYGIGNSSTKGFNDNDPGKECVICMTEPKDTAVLPCRHMCMCSECAKELRLQSNKCPICRQPIEELIEIKINGGDP